jgi:hypothetical protein
VRGVIFDNLGLKLDSSTEGTGLMGQAVGRMGSVCSMVVAEGVGEGRCPTALPF